MWVLLYNFPKITDKTEINYEEFISVLAKKSNLNTFYKTEIKGKWIEFFEDNEEKKLMELDSVKNLYNLI